MPIVVKQEPGSSALDGEPCCFCRKFTTYWTVRLTIKGVVTTGEDVAYCEPCAKRATPKDVPSKKEWMRRERIAVGSLKGYA